MLDQLLQLDHELFLSINKGLSNSFFDWLMPLLRNRFFWTPGYVFIVIFLIRNYGKRGLVCILFLLLTFALSDFISASVVKPSFERLQRTGIQHRNSNQGALWQWLQLSIHSCHKSFCNCHVPELYFPSKVQVDRSAHLFMGI